jgi:phosphonate transport system substrate-binding protein
MCDSVYDAARAGHLGLLPAGIARVAGVERSASTTRRVGLDMRIRLKAMVLTVLLAGGGALAACSGAEPAAAGGVPATLRVGLIPNISPEKQKAQYEPLRAYLAAKLKVKVELFVATDYAGVVQALVAKKIDLAYLGGLTYAQAKEQANVTPLVTEIDQETGTTKYLSAIVVRKDAPFTSTKDVVAAGAAFAFGDISSTSGSLYPRVMLTEAGAHCDTVDLSKCPPLKSVTFTGGHDAAAQAVLKGSVDAAGLELRILHRLERQGTIPTGALRVIETREVMGYPWVARDGLSAQARDTITAAFTDMADATLLSLMRAKKYVPVTPADYTDLQERAAALGLLTRR